MLIPRKKRQEGGIGNYENIIVLMRDWCIRETELKRSPNVLEGFSPSILLQISDVMSKFRY